MWIFVNEKCFEEVLQRKPTEQERSPVVGLIPSDGLTIRVANQVATRPNEQDGLLMKLTRGFKPSNWASAYCELLGDFWACWMLAVQGVPVAAAGGGCVDASCRLLLFHEHPVVLPHVSHFKHVPFRTSVKFWHSGQASPT